MSMFPWELDSSPPPGTWVPPEPEVIDIPADLPTLEPSVVVTLPLNEQVTDAVVVPGELGVDGPDVLYVAISQERVNVWAAVVYFVPEIALGVSVLLVLVALRKLWVGRRFTHRRGEAYCKKCWAGLTGVESEDCPECGRAVAKTKRVAKRSKRSPLSLCGLFIVAAVVMSMVTGTLWFGESWRGVFSKGFDWRDRDDWRRLVDPLEPRSPFRINAMVQWFDWPSSDLSAYARDRSQAWIDQIEDAYRDGVGIQYRLLVRRYVTADGRLLSEHPLPAYSRWQDSETYGESWFVYQSQTVLVSDGDYYYSLRYESGDPWLRFHTQNTSAYYSVGGVTADGRYIVIGFHDSDTDWRGPADAQQLVVFDIRTGDIVSTLDLTQADTRYPFISPETELHDFVITDTDGQVVLCLYDPRSSSGHRGDVLAAWDFLDETISLIDLTTFSAATLCPSQMLEYDYPWSIKSIDSSPNAMREPSRTMRLIGPSGRFEVWRSETQRRGQAWVWLPVENHRYRFAASHQTPKLPPYDHLDPDTDFALYRGDEATSPTRPQRVIRHRPTQAMQAWTELRLTSSGVAGIAVTRHHAQHLWVDIHTARATALIPTDPNAYVEHLFFANNETQSIRSIEREVRDTAGRVVGYRVEFEVFDLPD